MDITAPDFWRYLKFIFEIDLPQTYLCLFFRLPCKIKHENSMENVISCDIPFGLKVSDVNFLYIFTFRKTIERFQNQKVYLAFNPDLFLSHQ